MKKVPMLKLRISRKLLSAFLALTLVLGMSVMPSAVTATAAYLDEKNYDFEAESGTVYGTEARVEDESGVARQIAGGGFAHCTSSNGGALSLADTRGERTANNTWFAFNDASGLYQLDAGASYIVTLKFKVVSNQVSFDYNGVTYPVSSQNTYINLAYDFAVSDGSLTSSPVKIGNIATLTNGGSTFTRSLEDGTVDTLPIGQWHELTFTFTSPEEFAGDNALGFVARTFNGADIQFDDIYVAKMPSITLVTTKGTLENSTIPVVIGEKVVLPAPVYSQLGVDFDGWYLDSACTKKFTDEYFTAENCQLTLYAGWTTERFSFESYKTPSKYSAPNFFISLAENSDIAYDGNKYMYYHYTEEDWTQVYSTNETTGKVTYYSSRRTANENNIGLKYLDPYTTYVVTFKYRFPAGSGTATAKVATGDNDNIWHSGTYLAYNDTTTLLQSNVPDVWQECRILFTTGALEKVGSFTTDYLYLMVHATEHKHTEVYIDDVTVEAVEGDTTVTLNTNGGTFADGETKMVQSVNIGDSVDSFFVPTRTEYDFAGWAYDKNGVNMVETDVIDASLFRNNIYAIWSRNMGFEGYYYDLDAADRNNYISDTVSIVKENSQKGDFSAKLVNTVSAKQNVIALNPVNNSTRYLVTFCYDLKTADSDIKVQFASMNYNINNEDDVTVYDDVYTISAASAESGYNMGAVIINTNFKNSDSNRLAMLVSSESGAYTVYFDTVELTVISDYDGYILLCDKLNGDFEALIGKAGYAVEPPELSAKTDKFIGWYTDSTLSSLYESGYTYSDTVNHLYAGWLEGEGFENYTPVSSNLTVTVDSADADNKYLTATGAVTEKISNSVSGTRYGIEFRYSLSSATADTTITVADAFFTVAASETVGEWKKATLVATADSSALNLEIAGSATILIDDLIVYEITDNMSVITFVQKDGYGEDSVQVGVKGTTITLPEVPVNGTDVFYGWYTDSALSTPFVSSVFPASDITLYARWATNPVTKVTFDDLGDTNYFTESNSLKAELTTTRKNGAYGLAFDRVDIEKTSDETYAPLVNKDGYVKVESNTTYAVSYHCYYLTWSSGATLKFNFFTSSSDNFVKGSALASNSSVKHSYNWMAGCSYFTTGDIPEGEDTLYINVVNSTLKTTFVIDAITITRVDEGRNHVFFNDPKSQSNIYEVTGNYGEEIEYPVIADKNYEVEGWYTDFETLNHHSSGTHNEEAITSLYCRWDIQTITFDNYEFENSNSKYTVGDDISLSYDEAYDTTRSLKYDYNYAVKYFETANNTAALGRVADDSTYRITFRYKLTEAQGDVDIKFLTANKTNRWAYITNYDKATYTVYSSEIGNEWKMATVYLTTDFAGISASGLFMTFNPVVEGDTVLYVDMVEVDYMREGRAVTAFIGKNGNAEFYVEGTEGETVSATGKIPASQFAAFGGWYSDEECTAEFSSLTMASGINYVYSSWTEKSEGFDNYTYASNSEKNYAKGNKVENGVLTYTAQGANSSVKDGFRIGKVDNNTSYKVFFSYKTSSENLKIKLATADEVDIAVNTTAYNDEGNFITAVADGQWNTATVYLTTAFGYSVPKDQYVNAAVNKNAHFGDMLYMYFENEDGAVVSIDNVTVVPVDVLAAAGASVLTEAASSEAGSQAMRFYFSYPTTDIMTIDVGGNAMTVVERGIIFKNARNTATGVADGDRIAVKAISLENKNDKGTTYISKTNGFNQYWDYDNKSESLVFSGYVKDFALKDSRLIAARGYIKVKDAQGNIYTFYSADKKTTVKEGVELNSEITSVDTHTFAGVTWDKFTIVNPKLMPYIYGRQIEFLMEYASDTHNVSIPRINERGVETEYEIVIGDTTREASALVSVLSENEYVIAVRGTKLIIKGGSALATMQGVKDFIEYLKLKDSLDCGADLRDGYTKYGKVSETADDYKLTFNDDFNASQLDTKVWGCYNNQSKANKYETESILGGVCSTYSVNEGGFTTASGRVVDEAVSVRNGNLVLSTARVNDTDFTKGEISSFWNMIYQYGYIEISCKLGEPPSHVGWWMNGAGTGGSSFIDRFGRENRGCMTEYDLLENYGRHDYYASALHHWWGSTSIKDNGHTSLSDSFGYGTKAQNYVIDAGETSMYDDYHIFTFLWENDRLIFAFDGVKYYEYINFDYYKDRMPNYIILSAGMGGRDYGVAYDIEKHGDYYESLVDYVRIYQQANMGSILRYAYDNVNYAQ